MYRMIVQTPPKLLIVAAAATLLVTGVSLQPEREAQQIPQDQGEAPDASRKVWDPTLRFDHAELRQRIQSVLATEDDLDFLAAYWRLVLDTHRASPVLYQGDRAAMSPSFFLLPERLREGGWILLDADQPAVERQRHEIPADGGLYVLREDELVRLGEVQTDDVVFIASEHAAVIVWLNEHGASAAVEPPGVPDAAPDDQ